MANRTATLWPAHAATNHVDMGWRRLPPYDEPALETMLGDIDQWETAADRMGTSYPATRRHGATVGTTSRLIFCGST